MIATHTPAPRMVETGTRELASACRLFRRPQPCVVHGRRSSSAVAEPNAVRSSVTLTPAELRVAEAVARGRTNTTVSAELFISVKTVEFHLRSIYTKLGVRNRAEFGREFAKHAAVAGGRLANEQSVRL